ncbi:MAG: hypothetical protein HKO98_01830, partial [Gemmatimonadetes bacterium]|nr:hypothetical protein [Gemmatimonadota bacterium]
MPFLSYPSRVGTRPVLAANWFIFFLALGGLSACSDSKTPAQPTSLEPGDRVPEVFPGKVSDLAAHSLTHRAIGLEWTEVSDGKNAAAQYQIRRVEGSGGWDQGTVIREGACGYPVRGAAPGNRMGCVVQGLEAGREYRFLVRAERAELTGLVPGVPSTTASAMTRAEPLVDVPATAEVVSGSSYSGTVGQAVQSDVRVFVTDSIGAPLPGVHVVWMSGAGGATAQPVSVSDQDGVARTVWTLGPQAGPQVMGIRVAGHDEFTVVADAAAGPVSDLRFSLDTLALGPGEEQRLLVQGRDDFGNLIENLALEWESSNPGVARVDDGGLVTSTSRGTARVRASMRDRLRKRKTKDSTTVVVAADPQPVTDLQVSDAGESWLTTTFTEVDDGTGRPARYEARIAGPDTGWNDAVEVSEGSCQSPLNGTAIGASRSCTITGLDDESTHTIFVRSYRKRGQAIIQSITPGSAVGTTLARPGGPVSVSPEAGTGQSGTVGQTLLSPVRVRVLNESGGPVSGAQVSFSVTDGGTVSAQVADTDAEGIAEVQWTLGSEAGVQTLSASLQSGAQGTSGMAAVAAPEPITIPASALPGPVATVTLTPDSLSMDAGQTGMFSIAAFDAFGNPTLATMTTWTSDDAQVASVASNGEVTAQGVGRTTVRADVDGVPTGGSVTVTGPAPADPDPSAITDLRVVATTESAVIIEFTEVDDGLGGVALAELRYAFSPMGWSWGSASVVLEGECGSPIEGQSVGATRQCTVEGLQAGTAYDFQMVSWRVTSDGNLYSPLSSIATGTTVATEQPVEVAEVRSSPSSIVIHDLGGTYGLVGVALDGAGQVVSTPIQWSTTDADVATVDEDGLVMARGAGTAFIVATAMCCSVADTTAVTVPAQEAPQLASITVQPGSLTFDQIG